MLALETYIAPNFQLKEFISEADYKIVTPEIISNIIALAQRLQVVRDFYNSPIIITSGYRNPTHNRAVGGSSSSYHIFGQAADFDVSGVSQFQVAEDFAEWSGGMKAYKQHDGGHVHMDTGPKRRW